MKHELVLEGKTFVNHSFQQCCIGIDNGKITDIKKILKGDDHQRFLKEILLPAGVDIHVHFRDPGMTHKESFYTGSVAAAFGGISCVFDMPNTKPSTMTPELMIEKQNIARQKSIIDHGFYAGIFQQSLSKSDLISNLASVSDGFKIFLGETTNSFTLPPDLLTDVFTLIKPTQKPILIHAEHYLCLQKHKRIENNLFDHYSSRPPECETTAIAQLITAAKKVNTPIHICHVSSVSALRKLEDRPEHVTYGITPHHSLLHYEYKKVPSTWLKVNPPLRSKKEQKELFNSLRKDNGCLLESDHAPHTCKEKEKDFSEVPCGIPGVETMYPLYLALAAKEHISFQQVISLLCERPSKFHHISKGFISTGYDADIIAIDRKNIKTIKNEQLHSRSECSPFEGFPAIYPTMMTVRGEKVVEHDEIQVSKGYGKLARMKK